MSSALLSLIQCNKQFKNMNNGVTIHSFTATESKTALYRKPIALSPALMYTSEGMTIKIIYTPNYAGLAVYSLQFQEI
jgi:hypothetical protein